jgi:hypothetical protein
MGPGGIKRGQGVSKGASTENYGARRLVSRCYEIIGMGETCTTTRELREKVAHHYGKEPMQLTMYLPRQAAPDDEATD